MAELVVWRGPDKHEQTFGKAGKDDMFIVGPDPENSGQFLLMIRDLSVEPDHEAMFGFHKTPYPDRRSAELAAEEELVRILEWLDYTAASLRATG